MFDERGVEKGQNAVVTQSAGWKLFWDLKLPWDLAVKTQTSIFAYPNSNTYNQWFILFFLVSTFYITSLVGVSDYDPAAAALCCLNSTIGNESLVLAVTTTTAASTTSALSLLPPAAAASAAAAVSVAPATLAALGLEADNCIGTLCQPPETALSTKIVYALWVWCIFLTFPGTFAMQPAVTTQTFGHK